MLSGSARGEALPLAQTHLFFFTEASCEAEQVMRVCRQGFAKAGTHRRCTGSSGAEHPRSGQATLAAALPSPG